MYSILFFHQFTPTCLILSLLERWGQHFVIVCAWQSYCAMAQVFASESRK